MWLPGQPPSSQPPTWNYLMQEQQDCNGDFSGIMNQYRDLHSMLDDIPEPDGERVLGIYNLNDELGKDVTDAFLWGR